MYLLQYANIFLCNPDGWSGIQCFLGQFEPDYEDGNGNGIYLLGVFFLMRGSLGGSQHFTRFSDSDHKQAP